MKTPHRKIRPSMESGLLLATLVGLVAVFAPVEAGSRLAQASTATSTSAWSSPDASPGQPNAVERAANVDDDDSRWLATPAGRVALLFILPGITSVSRSFPCFECPSGAHASAIYRIAPKNSPPQKWV